MPRLQTMVADPSDPSDQCRNRNRNRDRDRSLPWLAPGPYAPPNCPAELRQHRNNTVAVPGFSCPNPIRYRFRSRPRSCFASDLFGRPQGRPAETIYPTDSPNNVGGRAWTLPTPMARSKPPPRPLREALRGRMEMPGWESGYPFGRPLDRAPSLLFVLDLRPAVPQGRSPVENQIPLRGIRIYTEIALPLKLEDLSRLGMHQARLHKAGM